MRMVPKAFVQYLVHFHGDRDYFECHEILEDYWKEVDPGNKNSIWVGFIQLAVSSYHYRRGNLSGALRTLGKAYSILESQRQNCHNLGIDHTAILSLLKEQRYKISAKMPYKSVTIPINDQSLLNLCKQECKKLGVIWGEGSNLENTKLIHKHSLRDRTDVILEREKELKKRKKRQ